MRVWDTRSGKQLVAFASGGQKAVEAYDNPISRSRLAAAQAFAADLGVTPGQIALAWMLRRSKVILPIPGTGSVDHLVENVGGAGIALTDDAFATLDRLGRRAG